MVVDDAEFNIIPIKSMIEEDFGIRVETAMNGLEALKLFEKEFHRDCLCENRGFRLIFMDVQMPVMDGITAS